DGSAPSLLRHHCGGPAARGGGSCAAGAAGRRRTVAQGASGACQMTPSSHSLPVHARTFRALLRLYPPRFREAYGDEMTGFFLERLSRARSKGRVAVSRLWLRTVGDVL